MREAETPEQRTFGCSGCRIELTWTFTRAQWQAIAEAIERIEDASLCASCGGRLYLREAR